jgi:hypothetical protein
MTIPHAGYGGQPQGGATTLPRLDNDLPEVEDLVILIGRKLSVPVIEHGWAEGGDLIYYWRGEKPGPLPPMPPAHMDWAVMHEGEPLATGRQVMGWGGITEADKLTINVRASL